MMRTMMAMAGGPRGRRMNLPGGVPAGGPRKAGKRR